MMMMMNTNSTQNYFKILCYQRVNNVCNIIINENKLFGRIHTLSNWNNNAKEINYMKIKEKKTNFELLFIVCK